MNSNIRAIDSIPIKNTCNDPTEHSKSKPTTNRIRGNGMTEEQVMKEILPFISGHGLKGDNHKIAAIVTRSLHAYPRLKHLYTNGLTHGNVQPPKPLHNSVKVRTVASASKILSV